MTLFGIELVKQELLKPDYLFKAILNESAYVFFLGNTEHCSAKSAGLSYEGDLSGDDLAAIIGNGHIEIRNHSKFPLERVETIVRTLLRHPDLLCPSPFTVSYQGRRLNH